MPDLKRATTLARFHGNGNSRDVIDLLKRLVNTGAKIVVPLLRSLALILSRPMALFGLRCEG